MSEINKGYNTLGASVRLAAPADGHDWSGQCRSLLLLFEVGAQAGCYLQGHHGLLYSAVVAAHNAIEYHLHAPETVIYVTPYNKMD